MNASMLGNLEQGMVCGDSVELQWDHQTAGTKTNLSELHSKHWE